MNFSNDTEFEPESSDSSSSDESEENGATVGRPRSRFHAVGKTQKKQKTNPIMEENEEAANQLELETFELLTYITMRVANKNGDLEIGQFYKKILEQGKAFFSKETTVMTPEKALWLRKKIGLSRSEYLLLTQNVDGLPSNYR